MQVDTTKLRRYDLAVMPEFKIVRRIVREHGYEYPIIMVEGQGPKGRIRKRFRNEQEARNWKALQDIKILNLHSELHSVVTKLTQAEISEAEALVARLANRYTLTEIGDYFFQHFHEPDFKISLSEASVKFRGAMEGVIRDRTLIQLKSTLSQFEQFMENCNLHEITPEDVERYLRSLRAKDGVNPASRKTWNNYRADLHLFFKWASDKQRRWLASNPAADTTRFKIDREHIEILDLERARELMNHVADFKEGKLVRYFALALFAGVRPGGELEKLAQHPQLVDLSNKVVRITSAISKTGMPRQIKVRENLRHWLTQFPQDILPVNCDREFKAVRKKFALSHDVLRHTFISMHIGAFKSFADAALESGNSEKIIRDHYLNTSTAADAKAFWRICPGK
ncbi:MAG: site-specific integrase [Verrucomicrobia bacterium]|nr:site-specific integrase [Verrucomicrobiota bacterium]